MYTDKIIKVISVTSNIQICKILGLTGVDLFSPSDVVEKRNTRKVCMCIRSFSKKSRSMNINVRKFLHVPYNLNLLLLFLISKQRSFADEKTWSQVPDFDIVTCMVTMPKDLVGCMRRSLELSHNIPVDSSGDYYLQKHARRRSRQVCPQFY